ncbi:hypothetical protein IW140_000681 [Coemansia sp. RSA 1813]|nr:hypothetical protein EV178_000814 [Coemansia sp. RSA 1646]KAJ1773860.1 hypothetical protein LPJ74_000404 [Coemansia sp. RSA 1843]KAJ2092434.1 hypothetical protein IW138_001196 [Coemansia sp. RSA 986]KAJ2217342.1 hypothetical protein EV179_000492 [Coemansia sp. RSA 487]KAJ2572566.1 hypothetical protein IW140_000681 [Coemansia sp. RSA 1813]
MFLDKYTKLIFIGDSNADNGNVLRMTQGTHPEPSDVYVNGRYSNGKMWVDHLEELSGCCRPINLAYGCATIDNDIVSGTVPMPPGSSRHGRSEVPDVIDQVAQLKDMVGHLTPTDLVFVQVGSNDLNSLVADEPTYVVKRAFTPALLAQRLRFAVNTLCTEAGARNVVVLNVRSREDYPCIIALDDPQKVELVRRSTCELNDAITREMAGLQTTLGAEFSITVFDTYGFQKRIIADPAIFGIDLDVRMPCFDKNRVLQTTAPASSGADGCGVRMLNPHSQLFLDGAHLAKRAQALLAAEVIKALSLQAME